MAIVPECLCIRQMLGSDHENPSNELWLQMVQITFRVFLYRFRMS